MEVETASDEAVARLVQQGDTNSFGLLVERYEEKLLRYGRKFLKTHEDIEDIVQDVFISAYQNIQSFDTGQRFSPWIYRVAHNAFVNALKKHSKSPLVFVDLDTLVSHPTWEDPRALEEEEKEMRLMIEKGLEELPPKYREVLILYYLEEIPYKEIADILEVPVSTVGIRIRRGKEALKKIYRDLNMHYGE
jgi:RNA polymerase sigma-70 factor (ECF subfamily)